MGLKGPADTQLGKTVLAPAVGCSGFHEKAVKLFLKFISHFSRWGCGSCFHPDSVYVGPCFDP